LKRNGAALNLRLADDSADANFTAASITGSNTLTVSSGGIAITGNSTVAGTLGSLTGLTLASGNLTLAAASNLIFNTSTLLLAPANGQLRLTQNADPASPTVGAIGLIIGPASANGIYITNRNANGRLGIRLGDDSAYAGIVTGGEIVSANQQAALSDGSNTGFGVLSNNASMYANTALQFLPGNSGNIDNAAINYKMVRATTTLSGDTSPQTIVAVATGSVEGVTCRVTTAITGTAGTATGWSIGDGTLATKWASNKALAQNTMSNAADYIIHGSYTTDMYPGGFNLTATIVGDTGFHSGALKCVVIYRDVTAPANNN
jgi:hypothetical protein